MHDITQCLEAEKTIKELRTRVAELEKSVENNQALCADKHEMMLYERDKFQRWRENILKSTDEKYATLLKASEGMEKALEKELDWVRTVANDSQCKFTRIVAGGSVVALQKALADFRAMKETMKKGAGK